MTHIATLECTLCSALLLVYPQDEPAASRLGWDTPDANTCNVPRWSAARMPLPRSSDDSLNCTAETGSGHRTRASTAPEQLCGSQPANMLELEGKSDRVATRVSPP
jgi:hypothetical protein